MDCNNSSNTTTELINKITFERIIKNKKMTIHYESHLSLVIGLVLLIGSQFLVNTSTLTKRPTGKFCGSIECIFFTLPHSTQ